MENLKATRSCRLQFSPVDPPFPWMLQNRKDTIHYFSETTSTMDEARRLARAGCPSFSVVVAETQTSGRGRLKRFWHSRAGGLYFTIILRPDLPPSDCYKLNFLASVSLARILERRFGLETRIKWPNDILVDGRKLVGMLSEISTLSNRVDYVAIGIGINVNNTPPRTIPEATSLKVLLGGPVPRPSLLADFLDEFETGVNVLDETDIISEWKHHSIPFNRQVTVVTTQGEFKGITEDIDSDGALILRLADGSSKKLLYGDCFF